MAATSTRGSSTASPSVEEGRPAVYFGILGPLEVIEDDRSVAIRGSKLRTLLGVLLVRSNEVVSTDRLIEDLWSSEPTPNATATLHSYVSQLRTALGRDGRNRLATRAPGYVLCVVPDEVDAMRFEALARDGRSAFAAGAAESAAEILSSALALWRGDPLAEFADREFARGEIARLGELRENCLEDHIDAELARGRHDELLPVIEQLVEDRPLRERRWGQLMLALYRANRQAEALRAYQRLRHHLGEELGIEPSTELASLEAQILLQERELLVIAQPRPNGLATAVSDHAVTSSATASAFGPAPTPSRSPIVGRDAELARLRELGLAGRVRRPLVLLSGEPRHRRDAGRTGRSRNRGGVRRCS